MSDLVLVIEDEPQIAAVPETHLKQEGPRVEKAADGWATLSLDHAAKPHLMPPDLSSMGETSGLTGRFQ